MTQFIIRKPKIFALFFAAGLMAIMAYKSHAKLNHAEFIDFALGIARGDVTDICRAEFAGYCHPIYFYLIRFVSYLFSALSELDSQSLKLFAFLSLGIIGHLLSALAFSAYLRLHRGSFTPRVSANGLFLIYLFSLAHLYNAAVYGQWETMESLPVMLCFVFFATGYPLAFGIAAGVAFAFKPQVVAMLPVFCLLFFSKKHHSKPRFLIHALSGFALIYAGALLPWLLDRLGDGTGQNWNLSEWVSHTIPAGKALPTVPTGANFAALLDLFAPAAHGIKLAGANISQLLLLFTSTALLISIGYRVNTISRLRLLSYESCLLIGAAFAATFHLFAPNAQERHLFATISLFALLMPFSKHARFAFVISSIGLATTQALVVDGVFGSKLGMTGPAALFCIAANVLSLLLILRRLQQSLAVTSNEIVPADESAPHLSLNTLRTALLTWRDQLPGRSSISARGHLALALGTVLLAAWNFYDLGAKSIPLNGVYGQLITTLEFSDSTPSTVSFYSVAGTGNFHVHCVKSGEALKKSLNREDFLIWRNLTFKKPCSGDIVIRQDVPAGYLIAEVRITDANRETISPVKVCVDGECGSPESNSYFDESRLFDPEMRRTGSYFDEIYYARAAFELMKGLEPYESTHPPFGKLILYGVTKVFGLAPLQWRTPTALFAAAIPLLVFWLAIELRATVFVASLAMIFASLDFSRVALGRLATVDTQVAFLMLLSYFFLGRFIMANLARPNIASQRHTRAVAWPSLAACGFAAGLAISTKWNSVFGYLGVGILAVFWLFLNCFVTTTAEQPARHSLWRRLVSKELAYLVVCLALVPLIVYLAAYVCERLVLGQTPTFARFIRRQVHMFSYHSDLTATHPFASTFYTWPFMQRPLYLFAQKGTSEGYRFTLAVLGNPAVWWPMPFAVAYLFWVRRVLLLPVTMFSLVGFVSLFATWAPITRILYIYHYYAASCFGCILLAVSFDQSARGRRRLAPILGITAVGLVVLFWPIFMGNLASNHYINHYLRWFDTWVF